MKFPSPLRAVLALVTVGCTLATQASCAHDVVDDSELTLFQPGATAAVEQPVCVETACPAPFATCDGEPPCKVDLQTDVKHCGSCTNACPTRARHGRVVCSEGSCDLACNQLYADCNGASDDGCETSTGSDPKNCGGCGKACDDGVVCWRGACGCPSGFTLCGDECKDLRADSLNCGACGSICGPPASAADPRWTCGSEVTPSATTWQCATGACKLQCKPGFSDCNKDFCGDGCEVDVRDDPENCGGCGNVCAADQFCANGTCACPPGTEYCDGDCIDPNTDPQNCGGCGNECPGGAAVRPGENVGGGPLCTGGTCAYECYPGYADCDHRIDNGCEVHLVDDQRNCGSCGNLCAIAFGQPCVSGQCLSRPCKSYGEDVK